VAGGHDVIILFDCRTIELIALNGPARRTGGATYQHGQLTNPRARLFLHGMDDQVRVMGLTERIGKALYFLMRLFRVNWNAEIDIKRIGAIAEHEENRPESEAVFAAGHGHEDAICKSEHPLRLHCAGHLLVHKSVKAEPAEGSVVTGEADHGLALTLCTVHIIRMLKMDPNCVLGLSPSST